MHKDHRTKGFKIQCENSIIEQRRTKDNMLQNWCFKLESQRILSLIIWRCISEGLTIPVVKQTMRENNYAVLIMQDITVPRTKNKPPKWLNICCISVFSPSKQNFYFYHKIPGKISDGHLHGHQEVLQGQPLQAVKLQCNVRTLNQIIYTRKHMKMCSNKKWSFTNTTIYRSSHREILGADWAFVRLAFLQPKPNNIMLIFWKCKWPTC